MSNQLITIKNLIQTRCFKGLEMFGDKLASDLKWYNIVIFFCVWKKQRDNVLQNKDDINSNAITYHKEETINGE